MLSSSPSRAEPRHHRPHPPLSPHLRLPHQGSIDAIHAGAALHCWPSPTAAASEISRVLRPGGVFVASTFLQPAARLEEVLGDAAAAPIAAALERTGLSMGNVFSAKLWTEQELRCGRRCFLPPLVALLPDAAALPSVFR